MEEAPRQLASSGAELASSLQEPTDLADHFTAVDLLALQGVVQAANNVDTFVTKTRESREQCREALQSLYRLAADGLKACGDSHKPKGVVKVPPGKLVTANFHVEQIWGQLDVLAEATMKRVRKAVKHSREDMSVLEPSMEEAVDELITGVEGGMEPAEGSEEECISEHESLSGDEEGDAAEEDDSEASEDEIGAHSTGPRHLESIDYDAMLEAGSKKQRKRARSALDPDHEEHAATDSEGADGQPGGAVGEEQEGLLPTEDGFLRLDDMEAFVQQAEAAHAAGDTGGFDTFQALLEGNELGGASKPTEHRRKRMRMRVGEAESDDEDSESEEDDAVEAALRGALEEGASDEEVDLYAAIDSDEEAARGAQQAEGAAGTIRYEDFFGKSAPYQAQRAPQEDASEGSDASNLSGATDGSDDDVSGTDDHDDDDDVAGAAPRVDVDGRHAGGGSAGGDGDAPVLSTHEKRQLRIAREIEKVEGELMADKAWQFRGEATAKQRPKDSALEIDLDFDRTMRPPPQPTLEAAAKLEDIIKERILELRFDNVVRVNVAGPDHVKKDGKQQVELTDKKSKEGLADEYAKDYHAAVAGVAEDRHAKTRMELKSLFAELSAKLDALSHVSLTPKPTVTDLEVHAEVPAIAMEEAAPVATSLAAMQAPEEAHAKVKRKALKAESEKTKADRHAARATKKRVSKRQQQEKEEAEGVWAHDKGIKSAREDAEASREAAAMNKRGKRGKFAGGKKKGGSGAIATNSTAVFKALEAGKAAGSSGGGEEGAGSGAGSSKFMY